MITVRAFKPEEWPQYRSVRLRALKESPQAFGSTFEDAVNYPDETWKNRLEDLSVESDLALAAFDGDEAMGLAWGIVIAPSAGTTAVDTVAGPSTSPLRERQAQQTPNEII